jgi:inosose dehydratase
LGLSDSEWTGFAAGANRIAAAVKREAGLPTVFHHHCAGYVETPDEIARLLALTDPALLGLVFDTGHYTYGSGSYDAQSAVEGLERFADRVWYVHLKDCSAPVARQAKAEGWDYFAAVRHGVFCELGRGVVDFPAVRDWLRRRGYAGWALVEQDVLPGLGTPRESAQRNRDYLRSLGL